MPRNLGVMGMIASALVLVAMLPASAKHNDFDARFNTRVNGGVSSNFCGTPNQNRGYGGYYGQSQSQWNNGRAGNQWNNGWHRGQYRNGSQNFRNLDNMEASINTRINAGISNGRLTAAEAATLRQRMAQIEAVESQFRANGLSAQERIRLSNRLAQLELSLQRDLHDRDRASTFAGFNGFPGFGNFF
jgi:hypothetical protein